MVLISRRPPTNGLPLNAEARTSVTAQPWSLCARRAAVAAALWSVGAPTEAPFDRTEPLWRCSGLLTVCLTSPPQSEQLMMKSIFAMLQCGSTSITYIGSSAMQLGQKIVASQLIVLDVGWHAGSPSQSEVTQPRINYRARRIPYQLLRTYMATNTQSSSVWLSVTSFGRYDSGFTALYAGNRRRLRILQT